MTALAKTERIEFEWVGKIDDLRDGVRDRQRDDEMDKAMEWVTTAHRWWEVMDVMNGISIPSEHDMDTRMGYCIAYLQKIEEELCSAT